MKTNKIYKFVIIGIVLLFGVFISSYCFGNRYLPMKNYSSLSESDVQSQVFLYEQALAAKTMNYYKAKIKRNQKYKIKDVPENVRTILDSLMEIRLSAQGKPFNPHILDKSVLLLDYDTKNSCRMRIEVTPKQFQTWHIIK